MMACYMRLCVIVICGLILGNGCGVPHQEAAPDGPWLRHVIDNSSQGADGVKLADTNGDGLMDIVTGWEQGNVVRVYRHPGKTDVRKPWPAVTVGPASNVEDAVFVDLDGDGNLDVVSSCEGSTQSMFIHWAPDSPDDYLTESAWKTELLPASKDVTRWMFCIPLQLDGRNGVDLIASSKNPNGVIGWFEAPADPRNLSAWQWHPLSVAGWIMSLNARDMDGDGDMDILTTDRKGSDRTGVRWLENPGTQNVQSNVWNNQFILRDDREVMFMALADIDGDNADDVTVTIKPDLIQWLSLEGPQGRKGAVNTVYMPEGTGRAKGVNAGDIDLDGRMDVVFSCESADDKPGVMWMSWQESPKESKWQAHDISGVTGTKYDLIELIDLDDDGDLDVLTCEEVENLGVIWYENPANN
jgi:hypothetical protein